MSVAVIFISIIDLLSLFLFLSLQLGRRSLPHHLHDHVRSLRPVDPVDGPGFPHPEEVVAVQRSKPHPFRQCRLLDQSTRRAHLFIASAIHIIYNVLVITY